jgi:DNA-binding NarL/FixJ family response regulator
MALTLSDADVARIQRATNLLIAPLAFETLELWRNATAEAVQQAIGAKTSGFVLPLPSESLITCEPTFAKAASDWAEHFVYLDTGMTVRRRERGLEVFSVAGINDMSELKRSELYHDWIRPHRLFDSVVLAVDLPAQPIATSLHCYYDRESDPYRERERAIFQLLLPAFRAGVLTAIGWSRQRHRLIECLERASEGVRLVDRAGRVVHESPALARLLAAEAERERLKDALCRCAAAALALLSGDPTTLGGSLTANVRTVAGEYQIRPALLRATPEGEGILVAIVLERALARMPGDEAILERFGLTAREITVARLLADGKVDKEIAATIGISWHTARRHVERVLQKVGVHSRAGVGHALRDG